MEEFMPCQFVVTRIALSQKVGDRNITSQHAVRTAPYSTGTVLYYTVQWFQIRATELCMKHECKMNDI